jgi:AbrB family looped-hinge helix DNA binding protein
MKYTSTLSSKGQVTVPLQIRRRLGVRQGDRVEFVAQGDLTILRPAREIPNPFLRYAGALGTFPGGTQEINAWVHDLRSPDGRRRRPK